MSEDGEDFGFTEEQIAFGPMEEEGYRWVREGFGEESVPTWRESLRDPGSLDFHMALNFAYMQAGKEAGARGLKGGDFADFGFGVMRYVREVQEELGS